MKKFIEMLLLQIAPPLLLWIGTGSVVVVIGVVLLQVYVGRVIEQEMKKGLE